MQKHKIASPNFFFVEMRVQNSRSYNTQKNRSSWILLRLQLKYFLLRSKITMVLKISMFHGLTCWNPLTWIKIEHFLQKKQKQRCVSLWKWMNFFFSERKAKINKGYNLPDFMNEMECACKIMMSTRGLKGSNVG